MNTTVEAIKRAQRVLQLLNDLRGLDDGSGLSWLGKTTLSHWESVGRQVLAIDSELVRSIRFSDSTAVVPQVFNTLPYNNPMVTFPDPPMLPAPSGRPEMGLIGFICLGLSSAGVVDTCDPDCGRIVFVAILGDPNSPGHEASMYMIQVPAVGDAMTLDEFAEDATRKLRMVGGPPPGEDDARFIRELSKILIGSLMYLCSTTLDAETVPRRAVQKSLSGNTRKPFVLTRVGWKIGAALSARRASGGRATGTGNEQGPQHRKAHFKTVWTGPGRSIPKTVFIHPYWTKRDEIEKTHVATVRRVAG